MNTKIALVQFDKCHAQECGTCPAAAACKHRMLKQETTGEPPMPDPFLCRGCGDCVRACPYQAVRIATG